ncbi:plasmid transfer protein [Parabacteroides sp. PF5-9]|uniref:plasmid transfer protein n=1 Tax=Parabacteroides sp. PF5-9 TaxID=1742404 RepID=UPI00247698ED|nr:plasmid transfer protein [Parabacteroides sp. PF5-9]MDH6358928.1 hypothetical protein [Parabacteroides sp. PF5-9]
MKRTFILIVTLFCSCHCFSQFYYVVMDLKGIEAVVSNHGVQAGYLKSIERDYAGIRDYNKLISEKVAQVYLSRNKLFDSLMDVEALRSNGRDVMRINSLCQDVVKYQQEMVDIASADPELLMVAVKTELELINMTLNLMDNVMTATTGSENNLLDKAQRMDLLRGVIRDLRGMKTLAFSVCRQMRTARRDGILKTLAPGVFGYPVDNGQITQDVLDNYKGIRR